MNRSLALFSTLLLLVAALAAVWEMLAAQPPWSPFYFGLLQGPIQQLRMAATTIGVVLLAFSLLMPSLSPHREPRVLLTAIYIGTVLFIGALGYGAATGMYGMHIVDPTPGASLMIITKCAGFAILFGCLVDVLRRLVQQKLRA